MYDIPAMIKYIAIAFVAVVILYLGWSYKSSIERAVVLAQEKAQLEQIVIQQKDQLIKTEQINNDQLLILRDVKSKNEGLNTKLESLEDYLNSDQAQKDSITRCVDSSSDNAVPEKSTKTNTAKKSVRSTHRGSSEVLKRTIRELSRQ